MNLYQAYLAGWKACLAGVDGRYWFAQGGDNEASRRARQMGWIDAFEREDDDDEPLPEEWLSLDSYCN